MTDLTEQWKKGELPSGWYYVRLIRGEHRIDLYINSKNEWIDCPDGIIDTVVTEVPSYEEWQAKLEENAQLKKWCEEFNALEVAKENTKLKELLKECREFFYENLIDTEFHFSCGLGSNIKKQSCIRSLSNLKTKINQALGEDE